MSRHGLFLLTLIFCFSLIVSACDPNNNSNLPTLAPTVSSSSAKGTATAVTNPPQLTGTNTTNKPTSAITTTTPTISSTSQADKSDEIDTLLDELNNALRSMDTLDDLK